MKFQISTWGDSMATLTEEIQAMLIYCTLLHAEETLGL